MKKIILLVTLAIFLIPQVVSAVWWNPFTWQIFSDIFKSQTTQDVIPKARESTSELPPAVVKKSDHKGPQAVTEMGPTIDLSKIQSLGSATGTYSITPTPEGGQVTLQTKSAINREIAWVNFAINPTKKFNYINFEVEFTSEEGAKGLLNVYMDGVQRSYLDEQYYYADHELHKPQEEISPGLGVMQPGPHILGFRLDRFSDIPSSVTIKNIRTSLFYMVDEDGTVQIQ